jgi:hypothetical protein
LTFYFIDLSFQVQVACETFPEIVTKIVNYNGFQNEDFDTLYEKANSDFFYNFKVTQEVKRIVSVRSKYKNENK